MPIIIPKALPAYDILSHENVFVMSKIRAISQDIRPLEIAIVNLMPTKIETETQLMRLLSNTPLQVNITLIKTDSYRSKNISENHLDKFYTTFNEVKDRKFDAMIITGAPVETMPFEEVLYWDELKEIMDYADSKVTSTLYICWGAQAGLYHHYGINKVALDKKMFGVFEHAAVQDFDPLLKGMNDIFYIPHSRHTGLDEQAVLDCDKITVLAKSKDAGIAIIKSNDNRRIFLTGHSEYDRDTLKKEYIRDLSKGLGVEPPKNYFINLETLEVENKWSNTANLLFSNWLNHYVYQVTPYEI